LLERRIISMRNLRTLITMFVISAGREVARIVWLADSHFWTDQHCNPCLVPTQYQTVLPVAADSSRQHDLEVFHSGWYSRSGSQTVLVYLLWAPHTFCGTGSGCGCGRHHSGGGVSTRGQGRRPCAWTGCWKRRPQPWQRQVPQPELQQGGRILAPACDAGAAGGG